MSTLSEIEAAIERLSATQTDELALWLEKYRARKPATSASEPDFLGRAKAIWGETPAGEPLSVLVAQARD
jgi:predicted nucleic acid-binding protein